MLHVLIFYSCLIPVIALSMIESPRIPGVSTSCVKLLPYVDLRAGNAKGRTEICTQRWHLESRRILLVVWAQVTVGRGTSFERTAPPGRHSAEVQSFRLLGCIPRILVQTRYSILWRCEVFKTPASYLRVSNSSVGEKNSLLVCILCDCLQSVQK